VGRKKLYEPEQVLGALERWIIQEGQPPTIEELRQALELGSSRTVLQYLQELEDGGYIRRWPGGRGIKILRRPKLGLETRAVPVVGQVAAGALALAEEVPDGWLNLPVEELTPKTARFFLLRVTGSSMDRALVGADRIEDGDLVLVRQQPIGEPGQIVVAFVDGEATVKRLTRLPGYLVLKPESSQSHYKPILVRLGFSILGIVTKVIKKGAELLDPQGEIL
jgi:repressor LexA